MRFARATHLKNRLTASKNIFGVAFVSLSFLMLAHMLVRDAAALSLRTKGEISALRDLRPLHAALGIVAAVPPSKKDLEPVIDVLRKTLDADPAAWADAQKEKELLAALSGIGVSTAPGIAIGRITELAAAIVEASGLTRDGEAALKGLVDAAVNQTAALITETSALTVALSEAEDDHQSAPDHQTTMAHKMDFAKAHDALAAAARTIADETQKAGGDLLANRAKAVTAAALEVDAAIKAKSIPGVHTAAGDVIKAADDMHAALADELETRLKARNDAARQHLFVRLALAAALLAAGLSALFQAGGQHGMQKASPVTALLPRSKDKTRARNIEEVSSAIDELLSAILAAAGAKPQDGTAASEDMAAQLHELAQQAHLLALTTSIEAAKAGDSGKGFAVIAAETKELAGALTKAAQSYRIRQPAPAAQPGLARTAEQLQQAVNRLTALSGS